MHEYTVIGHPRQTVIFSIAVLSIFIAGGISKVIIPWVQEHFFEETIITFSLSGLTIFGIIYFIFNKYLWKLPCIGRVLQFPNLTGIWVCDGESSNISLGEKFDWAGSVVITQSWDKILVSLKTNNSTSQSMSIVGGIKYFPGVGYKLSYHYENTPNASEKELKKHEGFCILTFSEDTKTAEGYYFNNIKDRQSYGEMHLKRSEENS